MNKRIVFFNIIYYTVILFFFIKGRVDPSSSLGYGYFILIFWILAAIALAILLVKETIDPKTVLDKIGIITATPVLCIAFVAIIISINGTVASESYFNEKSYRYKVVTYNYFNSWSVKRIEYYRSTDTLNSQNELNSEVWLKDSTWIYLSKEGDTIKKVRYENNEN